MVIAFALCAVGISVGALARPAAGLPEWQRGPNDPTPKQIKEAGRIYGQLLKKLGRIKTLSVYVVHGNFTDGGSRTVTLPPPLISPKGQVYGLPKTVLECFNLVASWARYDRAKTGKFRNQPAIILEHYPGDGADSYNVLYISKRTGWPLANGYSLDSAPPRLTEFRNIKVTLKRR